MANQQEYELKKQERLQQEQKTLKQKKFKKTAPYIIGVIVIVAFFGIGIAKGWFRSAEPLGPENIPASALHFESFAVQGADHIAVGASHPSYNSNPPTSGWHYAEPARAGIYNKQLPDEKIVHNMEHGEIWVAYRPELSREVVGQLEAIARINHGWVVLEPRDANDMDIALVAWGNLDKFSVAEFSVERVQAFINKFKNQGPEKLPIEAHL